MQQSAVTLQVDDNKASVQTNSPDGEIYCRLECDHSTPVGRAEPFETIDLAEKLFHELCGMVEENARLGEVRGTELI
jgi:hypothetical protein